MPRFTTAIDIDGQRVEINVPRGTKAWRLANSVFCPLGPAPTQAWFVMTRQSVNALGVNGPHTITWQYIEAEDAGTPTVTRTLTFPGLYIVKAERLMHGAVGDLNAIYLVEFSDARLLAARKSDSGSQRVNLRSYANAADYLTGTSGGTWATLLTSLWNACGTLGAFPGLPGGIPIDGQPENTWIVGLNAYRALNAVLDQLDCAICHNPLTNTYTIVQLGAAQTIDDAATSLQWNAEPVNPTASRAAANLNIYFIWHRKAFGQERDTELENNWAYEGDGTAINQATGIAGGQGTIPLWDDLRVVLGENNTQLNASAITTRAENRKTRYVTRWSVTNQHRIHFGLLTDFVPGGQIRAVLWRNWCDTDNPLGGTVTEFTCQPELVIGLKPSEDGEPAWFDRQLAAPEREMYSPPDFSRHSFPNYPRLPNIVQVWDTGSAEGDTIQPNEEGFHRGRVKRWVANAMATLDDCWILFVDEFDTKTGQVEAVKGEYYGPARLSGIKDIGGANLPVYLVRKGGGGVGDEVVFQLTSTLVLSGEANARICTLVGGVYVANGNAIIVRDFYENPGEWQGFSGYQGKARKASDGKYDITWMERPALFARSILAADFVTAPAPVAATITGQFQQGNKLLPTAEVNDPAEMFPKALTGAKQLITWNDVNSRADVVVSQQQGIYATATLNQELLATTAHNVSITNFRIQSFSPFNLAPSPLPTTVENPFHHQGENGKEVLLLYGHILGKWNIIQIDHDQSQGEFVVIDSPGGAIIDTATAQLVTGTLGTKNRFAGQTVTGPPNVIQATRACWIEFTDYGPDFDYVGMYGRIYGPAKLCGYDNNIPVFRCLIGEQKFEAKIGGTVPIDVPKGGGGFFKLWNFEAESSVTIFALCKYNKCAIDKYAIVEAMNAEWRANQIEC